VVLREVVDFVDDVEESLGYVFDALRLVRRELDGQVPVIGFGGTPWTLAAYLIEGGGSRHYENVKLLMYRDPRAWHVLATKLAHAAAGVLVRQVQAGAQAVQLFDPAVGCLGPEDYRAFVLPHARAVVAAVRAAVPQAPVIYFGTGCAGLLEDMRRVEPDVLGLDWRVELGDAWRRVGYDVAVQGNLDPAVLLAAPAYIRTRAQAILQAAGGRPGHIFNLGHGIHKETPVEHVKALVDIVHELSARR